MRIRFLVALLALLVAPALAAQEESVSESAEVSIFVFKSLTPMPDVPIMLDGQRTGETGGSGGERAAP